MIHASVPKEIRKKIEIDNGLVRPSVGIGNAEDLIDDIQQALDIVWHSVVLFVLFVLLVYV